MRKSVMILMSSAVGWLASCRCPERPRAEVLSCLSSPPPIARPVAVVGPPECPASLVCLTVSGANILASDLTELRGWAREAFLRCGVSAPAAPAP